MATEQITLYTAKLCPFAHRVELTLNESNVKFTRYEVDLMKKPEWYQPKVNPVSKVPALTYGGPEVPPDQPSSESAKLAESLVLVEFIADLYPDSPVVPKTPLERARARFFIDAVSNKFVSPWLATWMHGASSESVFAGIEAIQSLLKGKYALGDQLTIADIVILPFIARMELSLRDNVGTFTVEEGKQMHEKYKNDPKYARFRQYAADMKSRESFVKTWHEDYVAKVYAKKFARS
ncbi:hypothetical protein FISHEDRAFT_63328 [Fistulina hepatica ATCC 64428]|uniref:Glutathione S-transferase n=1 Tax=Fistulina hepatica ATCC 64428 TaxID=1128425 RepID=A0A0D7ARP5_9AGAR|nr:hypothetical protein FISHEDRAFT_63328 [Fistulina hepatica ATCC 64428]